jgi:formylglycine-generating enzyme
MQDGREKAKYLGLGLVLGIGVTLAVVGVGSRLLKPRPGLVGPSASVKPRAAPSFGPAPAGSASSRAPEPTWTAEDDALPETMAEQREQLYVKLRKFGGLSDEEVGGVRRIFEASRILGQGNPKATSHPMSRAECRSIRAGARAFGENQAVCKKRHMVPIYDKRRGETERDAHVCIDQFEFPDIPCEYPVTWVRGVEAADLCRAVGKRICDTHEWEGACAGTLRPPDEEYDFKRSRRDMRFFFNRSREIVWAYGPEKHHEKCATGSKKGPSCESISWKGCGSNTYPAGAFPECVSQFGAYDQHGNAAEHMNMPGNPEELASRGDKLGETEMKGSWFIFKSFEAHEDDCRWRAPDWHGTRVRDVNSHANYHLGFRCCRDVGDAKASP